ncbi:MAG: ribonuclease R [Fusobacterium sp. JB021]|nr:ribonuclease R [Fusobacterium sp. JB020]MDP0494478.1 ribonuclease R [Fusobacterium sp. JB021]
MDVAVALKKIREYLENNKKSVGIDEIYKILNWSSKMKKKNRDILDSWVELGELTRNKRGKYNIPENIGMIKGELSIVKNRFGFVDTKTEGIFIPGSKFNGALDGDTVLVMIAESKREKGKKEGEIYKVLKRANDTVIGILTKQKTFGFVTPTHSFGKDIYIPKRFLKKAKDGQLVLVKVDFFGDAKRKPEGKIIEELGDPLDSNAMIEGLLKREGLEEKFPREVLNEARKVADKISKKDLEGRVDIRDLSLITIDGSDAKDLDDAVYVEKYDNGDYRLIVSIADVSYYVKENSAMDKEAFKRGNSVYLVDRVLPMLPRELSNGICSLNPNEDKLVFTCDMRIDSSGKVKDVKTYKAVMDSSYRMTYSGVNKIFAGEIEETEKYKDIKDMLFNMLELSRIIRGTKHKRGSIDFDLPEIKVVLDNKGKVDYLERKDRGEAERVIEDFMITANESVAEKLFWLEVPSIYRTHEKPDSERIENLNEVLGKFGYKIWLNSEGIHPKKFQSIIEDSQEKGISMIVHKMILRSLKQARYTEDNIGHFGLASSYYTHFTSPIRRYADLMIHRILEKSLEGYPSKKYIDKMEGELPNICTSISKSERSAMKAEEESTKIKIVEFMLDKIGDVFKGTIVGFSNRKVFIETEELVECLWDVTNSSHYYEFNEKDYHMLDRDNGNMYNLGDKIEVIVARVDMVNLEIEVSPYVEGGKYDISK